MEHSIGDTIPILRVAASTDIKKILKALPYREREIFRLRTGLGDGYCYSVKQVAHVFNVSPSEISQLFKRAKEKFLEQIERFAPESAVDLVVVKNVVEDARELTPYLIAHLKNCPGDLRLLPWQVFEHLVAEFFASWGYEDCRLVGKSNRTAADIFALKKIHPSGTEVRIFVETKRWRDRIGVEVVDRVYGAFLAEKPTFGWHMAMVVTVGGFSDMRKYTPESLRLMGVSLKNGDDIKKWLEDYRFCEKGLWLPELRTMTLRATSSYVP